MSRATPRAARAVAIVAALAVTGLLGGCGGALDPRGDGADRIAGLWWLMFWLSLIPMAIVAGALAWIFLKRRRERGADPERPPIGGADRRDRLLIVLGGIVLPIALLVPVAIAMIATIDVKESEDSALEIGVTAHQFWWDLEYPRPGEEKLADGATFRTANEIHIPVGRPVEVVGTSEDVIHSFWVPQLQGKIDLIPGRVNRLTLEASEPGVFKGRCAELCGLGHAKMHFLVIAEEEEDFERWLRGESEPAVVEGDTSVRETFANSCAPCHDLRGVYESGTFRGDFGPDLTHIAARREIGAGTLPNTREAMGRWILDPHGVKPGNRMPAVGVDAEELTEIVDFLMELE